LLVPDLLEKILFELAQEIVILDDCGGGGGCGFLLGSAITHLILLFFI
jgi:hypothetical protein